MARNLIIVFVFAFLNPFAVSAQISKPGVPPSFAIETIQERPPFELMSMIEVASLEAEDQVVDTIRDIPWRFGENITVNLNPSNSGLWETLANGDRIWRLGILSPGAYSLNLTFDQYQLPPRAELYVYNAEQSFVLGAFTELNNQEDGYFATSLVPGESLIIEYFEPAGVAFAGMLNLELVTHAYRSVLDYSKQFGSSGRCNLNVACDEALGWDNEIDAVVLMLTGSNSLCTGTLINNTGFDGRPFLLTANHCYRNPSSLVFWFNWQSPTCENPETTPPYDALSGAVSRARSSGSDFWLLELNQPVPLEYNPYFAGWNRSLEASLDERVVGIHHPRGDIKKFSYAMDGVSESSYLIGPGSGISHWYVEWSGGTTTEIGSSGSPLFDSKGRIIGQLHGGYAACGNTEPDWYGRFGISWLGGLSNETRLSNWLDPFGSNVMAIDGYRPEKADLAAVEGFTAQVISVDTILLSWDGGLQDQRVLVAWSDGNTFGEPTGSYSLGDAIDNGGRVLYLGADQQVYFLPPYPNTNYSFKAWAYDNRLNYSEGVVTSALSAERIITALPYEEDFENDIRRNGWTWPVVPDPPTWQFGQGNNNGIPPAPYQGDTNAYFNPANPERIGAVSMLVSPPIRFGDYDFGWLSFHYTNAALDDDQDMLLLYYRAAPNDDWVLLDSLDENTSDWTQAVYELPAISDSYQLGFYAQWNGGHGICLDAISVSGTYDANFPPPEDLAATIVNSHSIGLQWSKPDHESQSPELAGYTIYRDDVPVMTVNDGEQTVYIDEGLAVGSYMYSVTAVYINPQGESEPGNLFVAEITPLSPTYTVTVKIFGKGTTTPPDSVVSLFNAGTPVSFSANAHPNYSIIGWWEGDKLVSALPDWQLIIDKDYELRAHFALNQYSVSLASSPEGIGIQQGQGLYNYGDEAFISTTVPFGWRFIGWKEAGIFVATSLEFAVIVNENRQYIAHFEPLFSIELNADPTEAGMVRGGGLFDGGSSVEVAAYAYPGWAFRYWEEDGEVVSDHPNYGFIISEDRDLTAVFSVYEYQVLASVYPEGSGIVTGTGSYFLGDTVSLTVSDSENWIFIGWEEEGELVGSDHTITFVAERDRQLVAIFEPRFYLLSVSVEGSGKTEPAPGMYAFEKGEQVMLSANPSRGWRFTHWVINEEEVAESTLVLAINDTTDARAVFIFPLDAPIPPTKKQSLAVYPNPGTGIFSVDIDGIYGEVLMEVFNTAGQRHLVSSKILGAEYPTSTTIDLGHLNPGIYILKVSGNSATMVERIMIR